MLQSISQKHKLIWGVLLVFFGLAALIQAYIELTVWMWVGILIVVSIFTFVIYLTDRSNLLLFLPTYVLWAVAGLVAGIAASLLQDAVIATYVMTAVAVPFLVAFLRNRDNIGLLIPAYVLLVIGVMVPAIETGLLVESFIPLYVLTAIALPFIVGFWRTRERWGLLIPAYVMLAVGVMVVLIELRILTDLLIPSYIVFAIAAPFFVVYARDRSLRWSLIPGGILAIIGVSFLIAGNAVKYVVPVVLILAGIWVLMGVFRRNDESSATDLNEAGE